MASRAPKSVTSENAILHFVDSRVPIKGINCSARECISGKEQGMYIFEGYEPKEFFKYFTEITAIPRGSFHEEVISNYFKKFAENRALEVSQDELLNIFIKKPATAGYENSAPVLFHGHMDMILVKDEGIEQDMLHEGIRLIKDGEWVKGDGTTLGADNAVGLAFILCILDSEDIPHPPLEVVITVREEEGKAGLAGFDLDKITAHRLIDFNWRQWWTIYAACAGDISIYFDLPLETQQPTADCKPVNVKLSGFTGGHSLHEIVLQRANAVVTFARLIDEMTEKGKEVHFVELNSGTGRYVIPNFVETTLMIRPEDEASIQVITDDFEKKIKHEYRFTDPDLRIELTKSEAVPETMFTTELTRRIAKCIMLLPNGVQSMCLDRPELPESSSCITVLKTTDTKFRILATIPSAVSSIKYYLIRKFNALASLVGATTETFGDCPEWPYNPDSPLLATAKKAFEKLNGKEPGIIVAHSSLELGMFRTKYPDMDIISVGGESEGYHTTRERFRITSAEPAFAFIKELLRELK